MIDYQVVMRHQAQKLSVYLHRLCDFQPKLAKRLGRTRFLEVRKHKVNIKDEQLARLVCYHPSTDQMINYRIHTNSEGVVIKVEKEKKTKLFIC